MKDLGTLVRIDFLLAGSGERLNEAARMLSASDREQARAVLRSQQSALHQRIRACIETAYGIRNDNDGCIGTPVPPEDRLVSLQGTFVPQMPVGADMKGAVTQLLDRWFEHRYPGPPDVRYRGSGRRATACPGPRPGGGAGAGPAEVHRGYGRPEASRRDRRPIEARGDEPDATPAYQRLGEPLRHDACADRGRAADGGEAPRLDRGAEADGPASARAEPRHSGLRGAG